MPMKKAGAALVGLALAGLINGALPRVYPKSKAPARKAQSFKMDRTRPRPGRSATTPVNARAPFSNNSEQQQTQPSVVATGTTKIAFASDRDGNLEIYAMDTDGGGLVRLTENSAEDFSPAWSPDGLRLAFVSNRDGNSEIYVMNADGTAQTRLTNNTADDLSPAWSPDGTKIAFSSRRDGNDEIYLMNPDGSGQQNLTNNAGDDTQPSFSPD